MNLVVIIQQHLILHYILLIHYGMVKVVVVVKPIVVSVLLFLGSIDLLLTLLLIILRCEYAVMKEQVMKIFLL